MSSFPQAAAAIRRCPQCDHPTPEHDGLQRWCDRCNWNVARPHLLEEEGRLVRRYNAAGEGRGKRMLEALSAAPASELRPRLTPGKLAAYLISAAVHLLWLAIVATGLTVAIAGFPDPWSLAIGAACGTIGWLSWPRPMRIPRETLAQSDFPALHGLANEVAAKLGGAPITRIVVDEAFNASYAVAGWRREPVLQIGLPLWIALSPQERVALLAHEAAHGVNGDSARGFVIGTALGALDEWVRLFAGSPHAATTEEALAGAITRTLSMPLLLLRSLLLHLLWQDKQRSEYFADYLAATVAGTPPSVDLLGKLMLDEHLHAVLLRHAYSTSQSGAGILALFRQRIGQLPEREWDRMRRASEAEAARFDSSHPPTAYRKAFLAAHPIAAPRLTVSDATMAAIDAELRPLHDRIGERLIARFVRE